MYVNLQVEMNNNNKHIVNIIIMILLFIITIFLLIFNLTSPPDKIIYKGFMLDCARQFFPLVSIKKILIEMNKSNYTHFHWDLSNNERFSFKSEFDNGKLALSLNDSKYYTKDDLIDIIQYAKKLNISVLTEFAFMGHVKIWNNVYPEIMNSNYSDEFNMNNENVYKYLNDLFSEVLPLTTSKYTHMSNDEISQPDSEIIKSLDFALIQADNHYKTPIIWDDSITQNDIDVDKEFIIQAWHNNVTNDLIKKKYKVLVSEMDYWYIGGLHDMEIKDFVFPKSDYILGAELVWFTNSSDDPLDIDWVFPYIKNAGDKMSEL